MCGDTGTPRWYVKMGNNANRRWSGSNRECAEKSNCLNATQTVPLRPNLMYIHYGELDYDNNVGIGAPEIEYGFEPEGEWIELITVHKGGLFGTDYRMLFPSDGIERRQESLPSIVLSHLEKRGLACISQPLVGLV